MSRLVNLVAPRSWRDALTKTFVFLLLINGTDFLVKAFITQARPAWPREVTTTTVIALPFVALIMAVLHRQRCLQQTLSTLATTDVLTGLSNRRDFMDRARRALEREGHGVLLLLDADHFKRVNDQRGHGAGDAALAAIGSPLRASLRPRDILGRLGGEEFAALLPSMPLEDIQRLGLRLCAPIPVEEASGNFAVTLSAGAASASGGVSLDRLMAQADRSLYRAKAEGRARLHVSEEERDRAA
ncbi:MAG TPA: GGDEF domain-containing protein [Rubellimicrobium sp.]|nr:GGDEF domain-containing protein [Rubellimicrobium sp.]